MHIYLLSQGDLSVYSGSEWRQKRDSVSSISLPTRADAEEQDEGAVPCPSLVFLLDPCPHGSHSEATDAAGPDRTPNSFQAGIV